MKLLIVQHGQAKTKEEDPTRALSDVGAKAADKVAKWLSVSIKEIDEIRHSGKKRAEQTASIFAMHLSPRLGVSATSGLNPMDDIGYIANELKEYKGSLMLVGHLPFMSLLTGFLVAGDPECEVVRFQNAGVVCLQGHEDQWNVEWMIVPDLVRE